MIAASTFKKHISKFLGQKMHSIGFTGSGFNYILDSTHFVFTFGIQASQYGGQCCAEYGIQHKNVDSNGPQKLNFKKLKYSDCELRERLARPGKGDQWWSYSENEDENIEIASKIFEMFCSQALPTISAFKASPDILDKIEVSDLDNCYVNVSNKLCGISPPFGAPRFAWFLMKYHESKNQNKAADFAKYGLSLLDPNSTFFAKKDFEATLNRSNGT